MANKLQRYVVVRPGSLRTRSESFQMDEEDLGVSTYATDLLEERNLTREELLWLILRTPDLKATHQITIGQSGGSNNSTVRIEDIPEYWDLENPNLRRATDELLAAVNKYITVVRLATE